MITARVPSIYDPFPGSFDVYFFGGMAFGTSHKYFGATISTFRRFHFVTQNQLEKNIMLLGNCGTFYR